MYYLQKEAYKNCFTMFLESS